MRQGGEEGVRAAGLEGGDRRFEQLAADVKFNPIRGEGISVIVNIHGSGIANKGMRMLN